MCNRQRECKAGFEVPVLPGRRVVPLLAHRAEEGVGVGGMRNPVSVVAVEQAVRVPAKVADSKA